MDCTEDVNSSMNNCTETIPQMDGNDSILSVNSVNSVPQQFEQRNLKKYVVALNLPTVASYNVQSLFPKIQSFKTDMLERAVSVAFVSEIWEQKENFEHLSEIETMLELDGLKYISTSRPSKTKGGGAAIIVNLENFSIEKLNIIIPSSLDVVWGLLKPKYSPTKYKQIIVCCFYSPPKNRKNSKMADHLVGTL